MSSELATRIIGPTTAVSPGSVSESLSPSVDIRPPVSAEPPRSTTRLRERLGVGLNESATGFATALRPSVHHKMAIIDGRLAVLPRNDAARPSTDVGDIRLSPESYAAFEALFRRD